MEAPLIRTFVDDSRLYSFRFVVLFSFSMLAMSNALLWLTYAPISDEAEEYYNISGDTIDLLLNWGAIMNFPGPPLALWIARQHNGLRKCVLVCAWTTMVATLLRLCPTWWPEQFGGSHAMFFIHSSQILISIVGPMVTCTPAHVSQMWFGESERTTATAVGYITNNAGVAVSFLLSPALVTVASDIPRLLYVHAGIAAVCLLLIQFCFPARPPSPPTMAASLQQQREDLTHSMRTSTKIRELKLDGDETPELPNLGSFREALRNVPFMILALGAGMIGESFNAWSGLLDMILGPVGYNPVQNGWLGFSATVGSMAGGLVVGWIADRYFQRRLKFLLVMILIACAASFAGFTFLLPSPLWAGQPPNFAFLLFLITVAGCCCGGIMPLAYEFMVELSFPLSETTTVAIPTLWGNIGAITLLSLPETAHEYLNLIMTLVVFAALLLVLLVKEQYRRESVVAMSLSKSFREDRLTSLV